MATDLPAPVAPAMSRCGISSIVATKASPLTPRPSGIVRGDSDCLNSLDSSISLKYTVERFSLGISMPTSDFPGIGASMRRLCAASASARSSFRLSILLSFTPSDGSSVNCVTVGPG